MMMFGGNDLSDEEEEEGETQTTMLLKRGSWDLLIIRRLIQNQINEPKICQLSQSQKIFA